MIIIWTFDGIWQAPPVVVLPNVCVVSGLSTWLWLSCYRSLDIDQGNSGFFSGPRAKVRAPQAAGCCRMLQNCKRTHISCSLDIRQHLYRYMYTVAQQNCVWICMSTVFKTIYIYINMELCMNVYTVYIYILYTYIDTILYNCVRVYIYLIYIHIYYIHIYLYQIIHIWYTRYAQAVQGDMHRHTVHHN